MFSIPYIYVLLIAFTYDVVALRSSTSLQTTNGTQLPIPKQGWTPQPDGRGTLDILWSCCITMFLCSWSILCVNIPSPHETKITILWRKIAKTVLGILCPELVFGMAFGQWLSARRSVKDFNEAGYSIQQKKSKRPKLTILRKEITADIETLDDQSREEWNLEKASFTEMGGFRLHTRDQRPFPINSQQLLFLIENRYVSLPKVKLRVIRDKNKVNGLLRSVVLCQVLWFLVSIVARWVQGLVVTTAELTTVSFIFCSAGTAFCWWHKPADVITTETLQTDLSCNDILQNAKQPIDQWKLNPLDFVSRKEWWWSKSWANFVNLLNHMHITFGTDYAPRDRFPDSEQQDPPPYAIFIVLGVTYGFFSVLFVGWNYSFPTRIEQLLWRSACVTMMVTLTGLVISAQLALTYAVLQRYFQKVFTTSTVGTRRVRNSSPIKRSVRTLPVFPKLNAACDSIRNNSIGKDPLLHIRLRVILSMYFIGSFYLLARAYILVADIIELRLLPASAYETVNWQKFWPHFG